MRFHDSPVDAHDSTVLVLSNSTDATAEYLCNRFARSGIPHRRFDTDAVLHSMRIRFSQQLIELEWDGESLRPNQVRAVIYRRPQPFAPPIEGDVYQRQHVADEWAETFEGFLAHIPQEKWINHPTSNFTASHKIHQLGRAQEHGLTVPSWLVTTDTEVASEFLEQHGQQVIAKPLASGYIERVRPEDDTLIYTQLIDKSQIALLERITECPVLFQQRIDKRVDVRLVVVDDSMVAVTLEAKESDGQQRLDIRRDNMHDVKYAVIAIPDSITRGIRALMKEYRLRFASMDFAIDTQGDWVFFEINPNGQWAWLDLSEVSDIATLFIDALR
jgi:glutathione synthase/RimK-type ligase-like ATP-grasp enzyme